MSFRLDELLHECLIAAATAQRYVTRELLRIDPLKSTSADVVESIRARLQVQQKGALENKEGNPMDLVTEADRHVQVIISRLLGARYSGAGSRGDVTLPFTLIGEEDISGVPCDAHDEAFRWCLDDIEDRKLRSINAIPGADRIPTYLVEANTISVFVDPIDGTNAFVEGVTEVPMTLIGIAVKGEPVAGVVNRIFTSWPASLNFGIYSPRCSVTVIGGLPCAGPVRDLGTFSADSELSITYSGTIKKSTLQPLFRQVSPMSFVPARGAGYKLMLLITGVVPTQTRQQQGMEKQAVCLAHPVHAFLAPDAAIRKWDVCAVHAMLRGYCGGEVLDWSGAVVRYDTLGLSKEGASVLPTGIVAVRSALIRQQLALRLKWMTVPSRL